MAGPMPNFASGKSSITAAAMTWAAECRMVSSGSWAPASSSSSARDRISSLSMSMGSKGNATRAALDAELLSHPLVLVVHVSLVQQAIRLQATVPIPQALDVRQVLRTRHGWPEADALLDGGGVHRLVPGTVEELAAHPVRHASAVRGIDEVVQDHVRQQHRPEPAEAIDQAAPVHGSSHDPDQMGDVGAVVPLALHDEGLRPEHLLRRDQPYLVPQHLGRRGVLEPRIVDGRQSVPRSEDDVHEVAAGFDLAQPVLRLHLV